MTGLAVFTLVWLAIVVVAIGFLLYEAHRAVEVPEPHYEPLEPDMEDGGEWVVDENGMRRKR